MNKVTAVLPVRNCRQQLWKCLKALGAGSLVPDLVIVDDGSEDGTAQMIKKHWPEAVLLRLPGHTGYAHAANAGLRLVRTDYAFLIRPGFQPSRACVETLLQVLEADGAEDVFCALPRFEEKRGPGSPRADAQAGKNKKEKKDKKARRSGGRGPETEEVIAVRDGCAMYRMKALEEIGWFDERHFEGQEAFDLTIRAALFGYRTVRAAGAAVRPLAGDGSGTSDTFRRQMAAGNAGYVFYKNLPALQRVLGSPVFALADAARIADFARRGELDQYRMAAVRGRALRSLEKERRQALDEGVSVYPETLADASFLGMEGAGGRIYPLFLAEKEAFAADRLLALWRIQRLLTKEFPQLVRLIRQGCL